jgi:sterol desaturase/sphingolipid hydroxylase (fatty acid hydroxylase superfamily)
VRRLLSRALFPLLVVAMGAYALAAPGLDVAGPLGLAPGANDGLLVLAAIVFFYGLIAALERALPYRREWNRSHGDVKTDLLYWAFSGAVVSTLAQASALAALFAAGGWLAAALGSPLWPHFLPLPHQVLLALVLGELGHYAFHRLSHESPRVWRLHAAHHSAERLYWLNATRFQAFDLSLLIACEAVPLALLGIGPDAYLAYSVVRVVYGQLQHSNIDLATPRWLDWIFSSPGVHRWHHSTLSSEGNHDYGAVLNLWDHVFGSFLRPQRPFAGPVGIGQLPHFPRGWLAQQLSPFSWARIRAAR